MEIYLKENSSGEEVKQWQEFLKSQGFPIDVDGLFGPQTKDFTIQFQKNHELVADGIVGPISWNFMQSFSHPSPNLLKSNKDVLEWLKVNISNTLKNVTSILQLDKYCHITESWMAGIACRETGGLIVKYVNKGFKLNELLERMKGDYTNGIYHGYSLFQIDVRSFPDFINSGDWKDLNLSAVKALQVLQGKNMILLKTSVFMSLSEEMKERAVTAAYNCGEGNVIAVLQKNEDIDSRTTGRDYSKKVFEFRKIYESL